MSEHPSATSKRTRGAYSRLICLECHERRIRCELPDEVAVPDPGELRTASSPCYRCKKLGVPCVVRRTRLGRSGLGDGSTTLAAEIQGGTESVGSYAIDLPMSQAGYHLGWRDMMVPTSQPDSRPLPIPRCMGPAKVQILPLRRAAVPSKSPATSEETSSSSDGRPVSVKRTRTSKPKVKTGCLTCKIRRVCNLLMGVTFIPSLTFPSGQV
jgi:hypothetical protein